MFNEKIVRHETKLSPKKFESKLLESKSEPWCKTSTATNTWRLKSVLNTIWGHSSFSILSFSYDIYICSYAQIPLSLSWTSSLEPSVIFIRTNWPCDVHNSIKASCFQQEIVTYTRRVQLECESKERYQKKSEDRSGRKVNRSFLGVWLWTRWAVDDGPSNIEFACDSSNSIVVFALIALNFNTSSALVHVSSMYVCVYGFRIHRLTCIRLERKQAMLRRLHCKSRTMTFVHRHMFSILSYQWSLCLYFVENWEFNSYGYKWGASGHSMKCKEWKSMASKAW